AESGSIANVIGSIKAIPSDLLRPGIAPNTTPKARPKMISRKFDQSTNIGTPSNQDCQSIIYNTPSMKTPCGSGTPSKLLKNKKKTTAVTIGKIINSFCDFVPKPHIRAGMYKMVEIIKPL